MLRVSGITDCCGAQLIYNFPAREQEIDDDSESWTDAFEDSLKVILDSASHLGMSIVFLNGYQHDRFGKVLRAMGFQNTKYSINKNHSSRIYLYHYKHNPKGEYDDTDGE